MKKQLLILTLSLFTTATLCSMQIKYKEITNSSIDENIIEDDVIIRGKCSLNHNIIIKGRLFIAKNAVLKIMSNGIYDRQDKASIKNIKSPFSKNAITICGLKLNNLIFEDPSSSIVIKGIVEFTILEDIYFPTGMLIVSPQSALKLTALSRINPQFLPLTMYRTPDFWLKICATGLVYENNVVYSLESPFKKEECGEL
ncbi:MAG: hypothetical protein WC365_05165 [Candidatus Babeliales bacterium]|jgi:hypothetical protein